MGVLQQLLEELEGARNSGRTGGREVMSMAQKAGLSPSTPSSPYMHGPGGLFGVAGLERDVISTRIQPFGLASELPSRGTIVTNPLYPYLTSFAAPTGVNPNGVCDDAPEAGPVSGCIQTAQFGLITYQTRTIDITRNNNQINRGEFMDLRLYNDPLLETGGNGMTVPTVQGSPDLRRETLQRMVEVGVSFQNKLTQLVYTGNPANNTSGGGYKEFPGLDILVGVNKFDALSGTSCPSLDSDIKDFNYEQLDTGTGGTDIVNVVTYLMRYLRYNADHMNLAPVDWVLVMRPELWYELTAVWPCSYLTYRCNQLTGNETLFVDSNDQLRMRDDMRVGNYLMVDGIKFPVILDTGIVEETNVTQSKVGKTKFASDIYVLPRVIRGGMVSIFWEYMDFMQTAIPALQDGGGNNIDFWTDGGKFLWHRKPPANWCVQWIARIDPRVVLLTPQLAGRINNIVYQPLQHTREPYPSDPYFTAGGVNSRPGPSLYSDWNHP